MCVLYYCCMVLHIQWRQLYLVNVYVGITGTTDSRHYRVLASGIRNCTHGGTRCAYVIRRECCRTTAQVHLSQCDLLNLAMLTRLVYCPIEHTCIKLSLWVLIASKLSVYKQYNFRREIILITKIILCIIEEKNTITTKRVLNYKYTCTDM